MSERKSHKQIRAERQAKQNQQNNTTAMNPQAALNPGCSIMVNNIGEERLLLSHLQPHMRVLEFGSGLSTNVMAKMVKQVISVEYDNNFYNNFKQFANPNATWLFVPANKQEGPGLDGTFEEYQNYVLAPMQHASTEKFDIVLIDGRARVACAQYAAKHYLKEGGLIFIHDYKHPNQQFRRPEYEVVEQFLTLQKHVFAMACFTVKGQTSKYLADQPASPSPLGGEGRGEASISNVADIPDLNDNITSVQQQAVSKELPPLPPSLAQAVPENNIQSSPSDIPVAAPAIDTTTCWYSGDQVVNEMNNFFDKHIKNHEITKHLEPFTSLLALIDAEINKQLLDLGCGTAMLSAWCKGFDYTGSDLPNIIAGCAMRNYPNQVFRACDMVQDDLAWISKYDVVVINGIIDVMQYPVMMLNKILLHTKKYLIIHRQDISDTKETSVHKNGSYGGETYHTIMNRTDFEKIVSDHGLTINAETNCGFGKSPNGDWENGGSSFLLQRVKQ